MPGTGREEMNMTEDDSPSPGPSMRKLCYLGDPDGFDLLDILDTIVCLLIEFIAATGCCGNTITLMVLMKNGFSVTNNILLFSLASCDLFYSYTLIVSKLGCIMGHFDQSLQSVYAPYIAILPYIWGAGRVSMNLSLFHIVIIAFERVLAVFYPFKVARWVTRRKTAIVLTLLYIYMTALLFPWIFTYFTYVWELIDNRTVAVQTLDAFYTNNEKVLDVYNEVILNMIFGPFCILNVLISSCAIAYKLYAVTKVRSKMTLGRVENSTDIKVSRILLTVCIMFVLTGLPATFVHMYSFISPNMKMGSPLYSFLHDVEELFRGLNSATNFFIYTLMSAKFKGQAKKIICR